MFPVQACVEFVNQVVFFLVFYYLIHLRNQDELRYILVFGHRAVPLDLHCTGNLLHLSPGLSVADTLTARRPDWSKQGPSVMHNSTAFLPRENGGDELDITSFG